jgi:hypothetical protein
VSDSEPTVPALYDHCVRAYKAMLADAKVVIDPATGEGESQIVIYEGFLTQLITQQLNLSVPYYTSVRRSLLQMGCIRQLRRGGGSSPSQWEMITEPTEEAFLKQQPPKKPKQDRYSAMQDQILALNTRLSDLEDTVEELVAAWAREFGAKEV